ncbi:MAG TPA: transketolase C-terminal domain-containing protein [Gemmatimonadaceae bacterium]|nr:transketolase C-terminal domain-containing protein [Gemmatimonadaceae bacterium]
MSEIVLIPVDAFNRVRSSHLESAERLGLFADMCRANTLAAVKNAGSGHLGSSFSAMDLVVSLYLSELNTLSTGFDSPDRDVYFSSKGHDVPGLYAVLNAVGVVPQARLLKLRRLGGLDGHPDIGIPGIEANSGSLGMGLSKGRGIAWAKRHLGRGGRVFVMLGDGELQEGQNYEALRSTAAQGISGLTAIVDHNKLQSDKTVDAIMRLGNLESIFADFGWHVARCDGHNFNAIAASFSELRAITDRPKVLIADTIKGRGVSFMEHPAALAANGGLYRWHAGAPDDASFAAAHDELLTSIRRRFAEYELGALELDSVVAARHAPSITGNVLGEPVSRAVWAAKTAPVSAMSEEYIVEAFGKALIDLAPTHPEMIVLDADLAADCRVRGFENEFPARFVENGIAEQDMVSMAGGLARHGLLPVVNSFASFLASRANEQIYNNATEKSRIIYACHYAGMIPSGPGKSHQSIRDISLFGALPNFEIVQPCSARETRLAVEYAVERSERNCVLRMNISPSPRLITLPDDYELIPGRGVSLTDGSDAVLFAYGPVMLNEALHAARILEEEELRLRVVNMPWLNRVDGAWLAEAIEDTAAIFVLEDHSPIGGLGSCLLQALVAGKLLQERPFDIFGVEGFPACGNPTEALQYHGLDGASLAQRIVQKSGIRISRT